MIKPSLLWYQFRDPYQNPDNTLRRSPECAPKQHKLQLNTCADVYIFVCVENEEFFILSYCHGTKSLCFVKPSPAKQNNSITRQRSPMFKAVFRLISRHEVSHVRNITCEVLSKRYMCWKNIRKTDVMRISRNFQTCKKEYDKSWVIIELHNTHAHTHTPSLPSSKHMPMAMN